MLMEYLTNRSTDCVSKSKLDLETSLDFVKNVVKAVYDERKSSLIQVKFQFFMRIYHDQSDQGMFILWEEFLNLNKFFASVKF